MKYRIKSNVKPYSNHLLEPTLGLVESRTDKTATVTGRVVLGPNHYSEEIVYCLSELRPERG